MVVFISCSCSAWRIGQVKVETSLNGRIEINLHWRTVAHAGVAADVQAPGALGKFLVFLNLSEIEF